MSSGPEFAYVEEPFIDQLVGMGWKFTTGNLDFPSATGRSSFRDVIIRDDLRQALRRINRNARGDEWLDEGRLATAISAIERIAAPNAYSRRCQPLIPVDASHRFQLMPATHSG